MNVLPTKKKRHIESFKTSVYLCVFSEKGHSIHKVLKTDCDPRKPENKHFTLVLSGHGKMS